MAFIVKFLKNNRKYLHHYKVYSQLNVNKHLKTSE